MAKQRSYKNRDVHKMPPLAITFGDVVIGSAYRVDKRGDDGKKVIGRGGLPQQVAAYTGWFSPRESAKVKDIEDMLRVNLIGRGVDVARVEGLLCELSVHLQKDWAKR